MILYKVYLSMAGSNKQLWNLSLSSTRLDLANISIWPTLAKMRWLLADASLTTWLAVW